MTQSQNQKQVVAYNPYAPPILFASGFGGFGETPGHEKKANRIVEP